MPAIRPPNSVSRKKPIARPSVRRAEVGPDHVFVVAYFSGCSVSDFLAVVEHDDAVGDVHHDNHVVLDKPYGSSTLDDNVEVDAAQVMLSIYAHPGTRHCTRY